MRTYSRQKRTSCPQGRLGNDESSHRKRRRLDNDSDSDNATPEHPDATVLRSSSPIPSGFAQQRKTFERASSATLPSSPPPQSASPQKVADEPPSPPQFAHKRSRRALFSSGRRTIVLKTSFTKDTTRPALRERTGNDAPGAATPLEQRERCSPALQERQSVEKPRRKKLVQMQLDLGGGNMRSACRDCGMSYVPSSAVDVALHKRFHARHISGGNLFLTKASVRLLREKNKIADGDGGNFLAMVTRKDSATTKQLAWVLLDTVNSDMDAVQIDLDALWSLAEERDDISSTSTQRRSSKDPFENNFVRKEGHDRFKLFLHIKNQACTGLCLAEQISADSLSAQTGQKASPDAAESLVGISRIWVMPKERKSGLATTLLDRAVENFWYGMRIPKTRVAFSQPTEAGKRLATRWFGDGVAWKIYQ